jgi:hypothetical protein
VALQEKYDDLSCPHEKLVDSHVMLDIAYKEMVTLVKSYLPYMHKCTTSQVHIDLSCANPCLSQANILPSTTSDLDNVGKKERHNGHGLVSNSNKKNKSNKLKYKEQSQNMIKIPLTCFTCKNEGHHARDCSLKKEEMNMSKSKGKKKWMAHIKCFKCSNMGHCASIYSNKVDKTSLPKKKTRRSKRKCYGCNGKGHEIASCSHKKDDLCKSLNKRQTSNKKINIKMIRKRRHLAMISNTFATLAGERDILSKNCLMGKISKPNSSIDHSLLRKAKNGTCASKVTHTPYGITKAIWVSKYLVTNLQGPNMDWVPPSP